MIAYITQPWPWYIAGPLIGLMVPALLLVGNKQFGISSTFRDFCSVVFRAPYSYLRYDLKEHIWRNVLIVGVVIGGVVATYLMPGKSAMSISSDTISELGKLGITNFSGFVPMEIFSWKSLSGPEGFIFIIIGGFLVGFGTRWANGCTSSHAITGLSLLSKASLISVLGFFTGGLIATHFLFPIILK
jgi:uncharacterized protein